MVKHELRPVVAVSNKHGQVFWTPDLKAFMAGQLRDEEIHCVLCGEAPCVCPPCGSAEYLALLDTTDDWM